MDKLVKWDSTTLKDKLDKIDEEVEGEVYDGFYRSRLRVLIGIWDKGEAVAVVFRGVETTPSYRELERLTGRGDDALKKWHNEFLKYPDKKTYIKEVAEPRAEAWTTKALGNGALVSKFTGDNEWATPSKYIESSRLVMGSIDLDPASNDYAQETVKATKYYSSDEDGLAKKWGGNIFLNPPYAARLIDKFVDKLHQDIDSINQFILLTNNNTDTNWFLTAAVISDLICFTKGRINFHKPEGEYSSPTNGQTFFYKGENTKGFISEFKKYGIIMEIANE